MDAAGGARDTPAPLSDSNKAHAAPSEASSAGERPAEGKASPPPSGEAARGATESADGEQPQKRRRRRRRGGRNKKKTEPKPEQVASTPAAAPVDPGLAALAGGLLSHIDERQVPCSVDGCNDTWTWTAAEQIAAYGQSPPKRECARCASTTATDVRCAVEGCKRTWIWSREAQIKHRSWAKRRGDDRRGKKRRRRADGPPRRKCELCQAKLAKLSERPSVCKVHGCTRPVMIDRDAQLRAWASTGSSDLESDGPLAKQMCDVCREFCRTHDDRPVMCGRPGCERSWTYKRGAQLQAFLAGRFEDPIRLCEACESETRKGAHGTTTPANVEVMPCIVPGCTGVWHYRAGQKIPPCQDGDLPVERMCDEHRQQHGAEPRMVAEPEPDPKPEPPEPEGQSAPSTDDPEPGPDVAQGGPKSDREIVTSTDPIS